MYAVVALFDETVDVITLNRFLSTLQAVPPNGNTTFEVVFLARREGNVENTLYIHTSQGSFKYQASVNDTV